MFEISLSYPIARVAEKGLVAQVDSGELILAHMGCMLPSTVVPDKKMSPDLHDKIIRLLDDNYVNRQAWKTKTKATVLLGRSFSALSKVPGVIGISLIDTMRKGSDYWRPGKLITESVDVMRDCLSTDSRLAVSYGRLDELCPSPELLREFLANENVTFSQYADRYARDLQIGGLDIAIAELIRQNSRGFIPIFYCTDPYIRGYCYTKDWLHKPYASRNWHSDLRTVGCHRVILVEEMIRYLTQQGFRVKLFELDQLSPLGYHERYFSGADQPRS